MDSKHVRSLIEKFEKSIVENERMVSSLNSLGDTFSKLDKSISKIDKSFVDFYELNDVENITEKSIDTISSLQLVKKQSMNVLKFVEEFKNVQDDLAKVQKNINDEYDKLVSLNSDRLSLKEELEEFKKYIDGLKLDISSDFKKVHKNNSEIKKEIVDLGNVIDTKYDSFKYDILSEIKNLLKNNSEEIQEVAITIETEFEDEVIEEYYDVEKLYDDKNIDKLKELSNKGDVEAIFYLGKFYHTVDGLNKNYKEAIKLYEKAAIQGHLKAQNNLGIIYLEGKGVSQNYSEAYKWIKLAAKQGEPVSQCNLAILYYNGKGVNQNYSEAYKWIKLAAEQDNKLALEYLDKFKHKSIKG